jgi:1,4-dihydroxy-2-naphthoate octaprenyltransferase
MAIMQVTDKSKSFYKGFWQVADPKIWVASTVPMVVGVLLSVSYAKEFRLFWMVLAFVGVYLIEIGKNAINECVDYISGADRYVDTEHQTPFSGGKKTIVDGLLTVNQSAWIGVVTMALAAVIGIVFVLFREPKVIWVGLAGFFLAIIYSLPPFKLCYRGFGEAVVGTTFGPLITNGMYLVMAGRFDVLPLLVSIPIGFLIANVLWINEYPDYEADKRSGKKNGLVRIGKEKGVIVYGLIFAFAYLSVIPIVLYTRNLLWLLSWLTVPMAVGAVKNCKLHMNDIPKLVSSNDKTVKIYMLTGLLFSVSIIFHNFIRY